MKIVTRFSLIALLLLVTLACASAQVAFFADFEDGGGKAVPNKDVNDVKKYKGPAGTIWGLADATTNAGNADKKVLKQTAEGCGTSGDTPLPGVRDFTDGIVQVIFSFGDDDSFGVTLRKKGDDKGYIVSFGFTETPHLIIADYADGCCPDGQCLDQCGCENGGKEIFSVPKPNEIAIDQGNGTVYLGRVEVSGGDVKVWYLPFADVKDPFGDSAGFGKPHIDEKGLLKNTAAGTVGLWHESWGQGEVHSVLVTGKTGFAVDARKKLATTWGYVKSGY
ncbi:MAG: hypothetical protein O7E52_03555 [Candidatus Poribacteria bacterium]|nr:hypothetical protein [Candidatus Poribacteria bacterium]